MKKIFTKLLMPAAGLVILPIVSCSSNDQIDTKGSIEIVSNIEDVTITQDEGHLSQPIQVKCFDSDKKELDYKFSLKIKGNDTLPNWISITDKNEIQLTGGKEIGTYSFTLSAYNEQQKLYSNTKSFMVKVVDDRHVEPTDLTINIENNQYFPYQEASTEPFTVTPSKEGVEEKYLLNDIKTQVVDVVGKYDQDTQGHPLFQCVDNGVNHCLIISQDTTTSYIGEYKITIRAYLVSDPKIEKLKEVSLRIDNVYSYYDSATGYSYSRTREDEGWKLDNIGNASTIISNIPLQIQNRPVTTISSEVCGGRTNIAQVLLPLSVTTIEDNAFDGITAICSVEMPGVKYVGNNAFRNCSLLEYRIGAPYPSFVTVGNEAFSGCRKFKLDLFLDAVSIGEKAFYNTNIRKILIGKNCKRILDNAFAKCSTLTTLKIYAEEPPEIEGLLFAQSDNLSVINVPAQSIELYETNDNWKRQDKKFEGI